MKIAQPLTPFWLTTWASALALGWLLPNHYLPWTSFHVDVWTGFMLLLVTGGVMVRTQRLVTWHGITVLIALLLILTWVQYGSGLVIFSGTSWVSTAYLIGLLLALFTGAQWESARSGQLADGLFLAIGIAAIVSVGLQLHQWLELGLLDVWAIGNTSGRPFANLGQPNELGTLLLWGLLAAAWGLVRGRLGVWTTLLVGLYLLFGIALTQSRTAWIAVVVLVGASWFWRRLWGAPRLPWFITGLGLYFAGCVLALGWLGQTLLLTPSSVVADIVRLSGELRPQLWAMFIDAAWQQPVFGFGWNQVGLAQLAVAPFHEPLHVPAFHSHNLFLDILLWCGIPIGLFVSLFLVRWLWRCFGAVQSSENAVLVLFLLVVFNHAMLELPLHHAYFLLPTGLVMGSLNVRFTFQPLMKVRRRWIFLIWVFAVSLLGLVVRDYLRIERSYLALRFEWAHVKTDVLETPPDVVLLNQLSEFIRFARFEPYGGMSDDDLNWMEDVANTYPSTGVVFKLARAFALNQQTEKSQLWLRKLCKIVPVEDCASAKSEWEKKALVDPRFAAVKWPEN